MPWPRKGKTPFFVVKSLALQKLHIHGGQPAEWRRQEATPGHLESQLQYFTRVKPTFFRLWEVYKAPLEGLDCYLPTAGTTSCEPLEAPAAAGTWRTVGEKPADANAPTALRPLDSLQH